MLDAAIENMEATPKRILADSGYWERDVTEKVKPTGVDPYIATGRQKHGPPDLPLDTPAKQGADARQKMTHKLKTEDGQTYYRRRKGIVEPVFGQIKEARGFRRFLLRGIEKVRGEWSLVCLGHNLQKLYGFLDGPIPQLG
jgi:hypothetical protein